MTKTNIAIIFGSTRTKSNGLRLFKYMENQKTQWEKSFDISLRYASVADFDLPLFDQDAPMNNPNRDMIKNERDWTDVFKNADGFIFITPEYNHNIPGAFKNSLDYIAFEGSRKPAKIISYSDNGRGGMFAAKALVPLLQMLRMIVMPLTIGIRNVDQTYDLKGNLNKGSENADHDERVLRGALKEISFYARVLKENKYSNK